ncbi:hypothetical protein FRC03_005164 [Tulasnella sp. 419]|nr:hypothetical protein FRC03_005164 [Tulasnella sp. 419]
MEVPPLVIGLPIAPSLPSGSEANLATPGIERFDSVAAACRKAKATFVTSWSTDPNDSSMHTVAMGCDDGSVFVFESCAPVHRRPEPPQLQLPLRSPYDIPRSTSPSAASAASVASFRSAPSSSPTTASVRTQTTISMAGGPPTLVQPRARVLSSVSKPSIEAPKTFVDYDNEPDNLRSMLKANSTSGNRRDKRDKEKGKDKENKSGKEDESTSGSTSGPEDDSAPGTGASSRGSTDKSTPVVLSPPALTFRAFPSANPATPTTPMAFRLPSSPHQLHDLRLKMHVAPPRIGFGHSVTSIKVLEGGSILASLQECGALTLFSTTDGTCISSVRMDEMPRLKPPTGCKSLPQHLGLYTWSGIRVAQDEGSTLLFLSGSDISESPTAHQPDTSLSTRVVVIRVKTLYERGFVTSSVQVLEKIGEWVQDGPARGVGLHIDDRGELLVYRLSSSSNLVFRSIHILPPHPSPQTGDTSDENEKEQQSSGSAFLPHLPIHIPNPFKSSTPATSPRSHRFFSRRRPTSYYHAPEYQPDAEWEYGRIELGDEFDLGETGFADGSGKNKDDDYADEVGPISGVSITVFGRATVGCVWSDTRVSAFNLPSDRKPLRKLCSWTCDSSRGVSWIEENSLVVLNQDAITLYNLVIGEPQNAPTASEEEWISNSQIQVTRRPELVMSIPVEGMQISCLLNPSLLLAITSNESRTALRLRSVAIKSLPDSSTSSRKRRGTHDAEMLKKRCRVVWEDSLSTIYDGGKAVINKPQAVTSILPVNLNEIILGLDDGNIIVHDLDTAICPEPISLSPRRKSESGMECPVLSLHLVKNARTEQQYIIGSSEDGSLSVWSLRRPKRWQVEKLLTMRSRTWHHCGDFSGRS